MALYEQRLQADLDAIRARLDDIHVRVRRAVHDAVEAIVAGDGPLANVTILRDRAINRGVRRLDRDCHVFIVRHVPTAGHLRFVSSVLRISVALERVGDYAASACREAVHLSTRPSGEVREGIEVLGRTAERVLGKGLEAFDAGSAELATSAIKLAPAADAAFKHAYYHVIEEAGKGAAPARDLFAIAMVLRSLKRVADQAVNICEQTLFTVSGETKERKVFRILFVDEKNDCLSQLAEAYARRAFPESGHYSSAGWKPASEVPRRVLDFLDRQGHDTSRLHPQALAPRDDASKHYHVIIGFQGDPRPHLDSVPFLTASLEWDVGPVPDLAAPDADARLDSAYRRIGHEIQELMEMLEGSDAG